MLKIGTKYVLEGGTLLKMTFKNLYIPKRSPIKIEIQLKNYRYLSKLNEKHLFSKYEGNFYDHIPSGQGVLYDDTGSVIFSGNFEEGAGNLQEVPGFSEYSRFYSQCSRFFSQCSRFFTEAKTVCIKAED